MKVDKAEYTGYLWFSNKTSPQVLHDKSFEQELDENELPFIVEGQLFDKQRGKSISIKYVDGHYICRAFDVNSLTGNFEEKRFIPNRIDGVENLLLSLTEKG